MSVKQILLLLALLAAAPAFAQKKNAAYQYPIRCTDGPVTVNGELDEDTWKAAELATDFFMVLPMDTSRARLKTEVRMAYDERFLYISAVNYQTHPVVVESLRRDWNFGKNDNFIFFMDPFDDQTNGFTFGANAAGAEWDGQQYDGGSADLNWENRWYSAVKRYSDRWIFEAAIPFKTLRYKKDITRWGVNFSRNDLTTTEKSAWAPVPRQMATASLAYTGVLQWDAPPPRAGSNVSIIPYLLGGASKVYRPGKPLDTRFDAGLDVKVALSSSLNLDATINPDFSQVEVDRQQTNLDRFELFFPERRQFFLENSDLFNNLGFSNLRPFFSRRVGLTAPIRAGARLSGRINKDWRLGVLDIQTGETDDSGAPAQNFGVFTLQRRVFSRSNVTGFFINKQSFDSERFPSQPAYNRNAGLEYNLATKNDLWRGKFLYYKSFDPGAQGKDYAAAASLRYNNRHFNFSITQEYVADRYNPEVGFLPRRGYHKTSYNAAYLFFPKAGPLLTHGPNFGGFNYLDRLVNSVENENYLSYGFNFRTNAVFSVWIANDYVKLLQPFDPTNRTGIQLPVGTEHIWNSFGTSFASKPQRLFTFGWETRYGGYYAGGTRLRLAANTAYRLQPYGSIALAAEYNDIQFPQDNAFGLKNSAFWLVGPRVDVTFTKKIYFTTFLQYNQQTNNVNLNTRFQWRYAPASDLYLVYTDNYLPEGFGIVSRAFVVKLTYWWSV
ncbi:MAG: carbohydrate binding family 9 domain-containing protein [Saprospiraceae bacterium]|nr:carbohydrate binding family 9 domain-containing protein [Saprospiraceae bacterium]